MSLQLVVQILVGRENLVLSKILILLGRRRRRIKTLVIQNMTPVELKKNEVTCLGEMPNDNDPAAVVEMMKKERHDYIPNPNNPHCREDMVEVIQEGMS